MVIQGKDKYIDTLYVQANTEMSKRRGVNCIMTTEKKEERNHTLNNTPMHHTYKHQAFSIYIVI